MNIHFKDKDLFGRLFATKIYSSIVGSKMYGFDDESSDTDYLHILPIPDIIKNDIFRTYHQLQFKVNNEDHVFVFLDTFFKNIFNGDSTINFEVFKEIKENSSLDWCIKYKDSMDIYPIVKAYLGFAKRDIKYFPHSKDLRSKKRKLKHIYRGYFSAKMILEKSFNVSSLKENKIFKEIDNYGENFDFEKTLNQISNEISKLRQTAYNALYEDNGLKYFLATDIQQVFNDDYNYFISDNYYDDALEDDGWKEIMNLYYNVNVNGLIY